MSVLVFAVMVPGLAALALAMDRHVQHLPSGLRKTRALRALGMLALACSWLWLAAALGAAQASLLWLGLLTPATLCVAAAMAWLDRRQRRR